MVTVAGVTRGHAGILEEVGGPAYLTQLLTAMVGVINAGEYGRAIFDTWMRRQLIDIWRNRRQQRLRRRPRIWQVGRPATVVCATVGVRDARRNGRVVCGMLKAVAWH